MKTQYYRSSLALYYALFLRHKLKGYRSSSFLFLPPGLYILVDKSEHLTLDELWGRHGGAGYRLGVQIVVT